MLVGDRGHEPVADAAHGGDQPLSLSVVPDRPPGRLEPAGQRRVADEPVAPDRVEQLGLGYDAVAVGEQVDQDLEDLGLDVHSHPGTMKLEACRVQLTGLEGVHHGSRNRPLSRVSPAGRQPRSSRGSPRDLHAASMRRGVRPTAPWARHRPPSGARRGERDVGTGPRRGRGWRNGGAARRAGAERVVHAGDRRGARRADGGSRAPPRRTAGTPRARVPGTGGRDPGRAVPGPAGRGGRRGRGAGRRPLALPLLARRARPGAGRLAGGADAVRVTAVPRGRRTAPGGCAARRHLPRRHRGDGADPRRAQRRVRRLGAGGQGGRRPATPLPSGRSGPSSSWTPRDAPAASRAGCPRWATSAPRRSGSPSGSATPASSCACRRPCTPGTWSSRAAPRPGRSGWRCSPASGTAGR